MTVYDTIGKNYNSTRQAEPTIAAAIFNHLNATPNGKYLDVGCGSGNYLKALQEMGLVVYGVDPSALMLEAAANQCVDTTLVNANADNMPFENNFFDGAAAVLTTHHWTNPEAGYLELARVLKPGSRLVIFTFTPEQMEGYWLFHYFPEMIAKCMELCFSADHIEKSLLSNGYTSVQFEKYHVEPDGKDQFMYAYKHKPEKYLNEHFRNNTSGFRLHAEDRELKRGLAQLKSDIETGQIQTIIEKYIAANTKGDYLFVIATK